MILVTLGTQKEQFTRLLDYIENSNIDDEIIVQAGHTKYESKKMKIFDFIPYEEMNKYINKADIIITHAGTGSVLTPLKKNKKVIVCARLQKYGEHIDNHQQELVEVLKEEGYVLELDENNSLDDLIVKIKKFKPKKYVSNTDNFIKKLQDDIDKPKKTKKLKKIIVIFCILIVIFVIALINYLNLNEEQLPIIYYHNIAYQDEIEKYSLDQGYTFSLEIFEEEMKYLYDNGYTSINMQEFSCWKQKKCKLPEKAVMITFDDGCYSLKEYIEPILEKYNLNAVAFIITDRVEDITSNYTPGIIKYVGNDYIKNSSNIFEFGSHSNGLHYRTENGNMPIASTMTEEELLKDLNTSYSILNSNIFAYPFTYFDRNLIHALKDSKYEYALRIHNKKTYQNESNYLISRIGDTANMDSFKKIFETDTYDQTVLDKIKGIWIKIKYI
ncbi:MAG: PssE/Cps14G family polysaccharide biosynthesis glycosyltransferase [Bacilli bacterium]